MKSFSLLTPSIAVLEYDCQGPAAVYVMPYGTVSGDMGLFSLFLCDLREGN